MTENVKLPASHIGFGQISEDVLGNGFGDNGIVRIVLGCFGRCGCAGITAGCGEKCQQDGLRGKCGG